MENKKVELPGDTIVEAQQDTAIEREMAHQKSIFCNAYLRLMESKLGVKNFQKQRETLWNHVAECWDLAEAGKQKYRELEGFSHSKILNWKDLEKPLRQWLENTAVGEGWSQDIVDKTVAHYRFDFTQNQKHVNERLQQITDPDSDFKRRVLNPETREAAIAQYIQNHINSKHYTVMALNVIFEELERRR